MTALKDTEPSHCAVRVYLYWRGRGFSREDARLAVEEFRANRAA